MGKLTLATSRSPYAGGFFAAVLSGSSPLPWPSVSLSTSAPSFSPFRANISTLQDSLDVTGFSFASLSRGVTTLQHHQLPDGTGCLLHGGLTLTVTGLTPASRRWLCRTHQRVVGPLVAQHVAGKYNSVQIKMPVYAINQ